MQKPRNPISTFSDCRALRDLSRRGNVRAGFWGLLMGLTFVASTGAATGKCKDLFESAATELSADSVDASTLRQIDELIQLRLELIETEDATLRQILEPQFTDRFNDLQVTIGPQFPNFFRDRLKQVRALKDLTSEKDSEQRAEKLKSQVRDLKKWQRVRKHDIPRRPGPFLDQDSFFVLINGDLVLYNFRTQKKIFQKPVGDVSWKTHTLLSPDKKTVYLVNKNKIGLFDMSTQSMKWVDLPRVAADSGWRDTYLTKDGRHLVGAGEDGEVLIWEATTAEHRLIHWEENGTYAREPGIIESPDQRYLFIFKSNNAEFLFDRLTGKSIPTPNMSKPPVYHVYRGFFTADSKYLMFLNHNNTFYFYSLASEKIEGAYNQIRGDRDQLITPTIDNRYIIATMDIGNRWPKPPPFSIHEMSPGLPEVKIDLLGEDFSRPSDFVYHAASNALYFTDQHRVPGASSPHRATMYRFDLLTMKLEVIEQDTALAPSIESMDPAGQSIFFRKGNSDELTELY